MPGGYKLEGYEKGGVVQIVEKDHVDFFRDVGKYFYPTLLIILGHLFYYYTGNWGYPLFIGNLKIILHHFYNDETNQDKKNISKKSEKIFMKDWRFNIPLYTCHFVETLTWIWALCVMSDQVKWNHPYLRDT